MGDESPDFELSVKRDIRLGITRLINEKQEWIAGKSIGLITNHTGVNECLQHTINLLADVPGTKLTAIFTPEHGLWGAVQDGIAISSGRIGTVNVFSLYGETKPAEQLEEIDVLVYDMQDVGARCYTYLTTLLRAMEAAGGSGKEFIVTDRPNPIGCMVVEGRVLGTPHRKFESFIGVHAIPMRYALTIGELAQLLKVERQLPVSLKIAWMHGYTRELWYDETGLVWVPPSPNMPTLTTATVYPGMCLFEGTNLSEGRGTTTPFEVVGAPWCNEEKWVQGLEACGLPGVLFRPTVFTPAPVTETTKHANQTCHGVAVHITDRENFRPIETAICMLVTLLRENTPHFAFLSTHFDNLAGTDWLRLALLEGVDVDSILEHWREGVTAWAASTSEYQYYPGAVRHETVL